MDAGCLFGEREFILPLSSPHKYPSMTTKAVKCSVEEKLLDDGNGKEIISFTRKTSEEELFSYINNFLLCFFLVLLWNVRGFVCRSGLNPIFFVFKTYF